MMEYKGYFAKVDFDDVQARKDGKSLNTLVHDALLKAVKNSKQQVIQD